MHRILFFALIVSFLLNACLGTQEDFSQKKCACDSIKNFGDGFPDSLCGTYVTRPVGGGGGGGGYSIELKENNFYVSNTNSCEDEFVDSGRFKYKNGRVVLYSCLKPNAYNYSRLDRGSILYSSNGKLFFSDDRKDPLLKYDRAWNFEYSLDSSGNGYAEEFDDQKRMIRAGDYENRKFRKGFQFFYDKSGKLYKVIRDDSSIVLKDSLPELIKDWNEKLKQAKHF